ncbi:MAG TPA: hypothetical protein VFE78_29090 [Gemmataceae bacterium]|nr:hypothetical protein [Gemmataceae bacterium]
MFDSLAAQVWPELVGSVSRSFPSAEESQVIESIEDALLAFREKPLRFDPARGVPLDDYLAMRSRGYLKNRLRGERRHRRREQTGLSWDEKFEEKMEFRVTGGVGRTIPIGEAEEAELQRRELERRLEFLGPCERALVDLWQRGIDTLEAWAEALGIADLPREEQDRLIRAKKMSLKRKLRKPPAGGPDGASS